jgi:hypothetical protein
MRTHYHNIEVVILSPLVLCFMLQFPVTIDPAFAGPRTMTKTATVTVLQGTVDRIPAGSRQAIRSEDGMDVAIGDRIVTRVKGNAVITFLNGTTVAVQPDSDVMVKNVDTVGNKVSHVSIHINYGTVWARVVRSSDPKSRFTLESYTATATVHDGLIGGKVDTRRRFECWTRDGIMAVKDERGQRYVTLKPGEKTVVEPGNFNARFGFRNDPDPLAQPFAVNQSELRVKASPAVYPLIVMEDQSRIAGFTGQRKQEVNQVFGSYTGSLIDGTNVIEVPAGVPGPFLLVLEAGEDTTYQVEVASHYNGEPIAMHNISGAIKKGERVSTAITHAFDNELASYPQMARVVSSRMGAVRAFNGPAPGKFVVTEYGTSNSESEERATLDIER